ncbi:MAG: acetate--CoA ligase family protein, partial [Candidatus Binatia bacterium]
MNQKTLRTTIRSAIAAGRQALSVPEAQQLCEAYGIPTPKQGLAKTAAEAAKIASRFGFPVVLKIVSDDILHKTEASGVIVGVENAAEVRRGFDQLVKNAKRYKKNAGIQGVQVQQMVKGGQEVMVGAVTDPSFGKMIAFGLGGILVEVMKDITFRMTPVGKKEALSMLDSIAAAEVLRGVRGAKGVDREALADIIIKVSKLVSDFPEILEVDLNPIFATEKGARAVDVRIIVGDKPQARQNFDQSEILAAMQRIMNPRSVAVIGASAEDGKIGNSVMKNLINGGYQGEIYPVHPKAQEILERKAYPSVLDIADEIDVAVFAIPAKFCAAAMDEVGRKKIPGAVMIPSGFAEVGEQALQDELLAVARKHNVRVMGPNIYGFYYTPQNLCATFCTPYDVKGKVALSSQSGGVGMSIIGFSRTTRMGVSAIVGLGNKCDLDEDDLLTYFEQDDNTQVIAMHCEDLKDGRSFAEVASRVSKKKPIVMLKAGRTALGARAAASHTGALAGNDKIYDDVLRQCGVIRAKSLNDMLQFARGLQVLPNPKGENIVIITGAGGSGVLLSDACVDNGLALMKMPPDMDAAFRKFIPPFGAAGNPVDITGGEPPTTYANTIRYALGEPRIHSLILGYWHTIITPPMAFAKLCAEVVQEARDKGIDKPVVASLVG